MSSAMEKYMKVPHRIQARYGVTVQTFTTMLANNMQTCELFVTRKRWEIQLVAGWWLRNLLWKMMELVGMMKFPTEWKHDKFMFQTIKQWEIHSSSGKASEILMTTARAWMDGKARPLTVGLRMIHVLQYQNWHECKTHGLWG